MGRQRAFVALVVGVMGIGGALASSPRRGLLNREFLRRAGWSSAPGGEVPRSVLVSANGKERAVAAYGKLPLSFEANRGQTDAQVKFLSRGCGYSLFLMGTETVLALNRANSVPARGELRAGSVNEEGSWNPRATDTASAVLRMKLVGANPAADVVGVDELPGKSNYFIGSDPKKWRTNVPRYAKVKDEGVYPGVNLVHYGNQCQLEYDFVVAPGANPETIRLSFSGVDGLEIDAQGDLVLRTAAGEVRQHRPVVYQEIAGVRQAVAGNYVLRNKGEVGFAVAQYDTSKPLVIDPVLSYSSYLGGSGSDGGSGIAADSAGNAYITGSTSSADFPTTAGAFRTTSGGGSHAFVVKLNPAGSQLVYATYLGGSGSDSGSGIAVDSSGNAYVTGSTRSADYPTTPGGVQITFGGGSDAFVTKLNSAGSQLVYSTYLGGSSTDSGSGIAVDATGNAYVTGQTFSTNFPTVNPRQISLSGFSDAFVAKIDTTASGAASLVYSTYLGGSGQEEGRAIAVDSSGNAYVTGWTQSSNFPTANPLQASVGGGSCVTAFGSALSSNLPTTVALLASIRGGTWFRYFYSGFEITTCADAFVSKLNPNGSALVFSTYLGGSNDDRGAGISVDSSGNIYVTGRTSSANFPTANPIQGALRGSTDAFVARLNATGSPLMFSTYLGGDADDQGTGIAVDSSGNAYVTGNTSSTNFPTVSPVQVLSGGSHSFVTKLNPAGAALYSSYLGGNDVDQGSGIAVDGAGNSYVTGTTRSTNFPTVNPLEASLSGFSDAFISKIAPIPGPAVATLPASLTFQRQPLNTTSSPQTVTLTNKGDGALTITGITIAGTNSGDFAQMNTCDPFPKTLDPNGMCSIDVTFTPSATGLRSGSVTIRDNAAGSPHTVPLLGNMPDFTISASSGAATVLAGGSATSTITITPINDFAGAVSLACSGLPALSNCAFSPNPVTVGANPGISTLTVRTTAGSAFLVPPFEPLRVRPVYAIWLALLGAVFVAVAIRERESAKNRIGSICAGLLLMLLALQQGCGGKSETVKQTFQGTQRGTYNITVTGRFSSLQHSSVFTLTVQ